MSIGERLKRLRNNGLIRVKDLASQVGVSPSFIYQLEQNKVTPSYSTISKLARALGTTVPVLLGGETPEKWVLAKKKDCLMLVTDEEGVLLEAVPFLGFRKRRMQVLIFTLQPGATHSQMVFDHEREDLLYLESGAITVELENRSLRMGTGDFAHLVLERPRAIVNTGSEPAGGIWIISPPHLNDNQDADTRRKNLQ
ncbi:MAG TPA: XRE family transcriptional regulator [Candidatus Limnocylindrales bacterium]|nr:XRE family transcriptional regulator [Candidatus Limnocylindrales bacterium]